MYGKERAFLPLLNPDYARYDTMPPARLTNYVQAAYAPRSNEVLRGSPDKYRGFPETDAWQPIAVYRSLGSRAETTPVTAAAPLSRIHLDGSITGWYLKGDQLPTQYGRPAPAPYELYYFGVGLHLMYREEVRALADVVLSTNGWNVWRGGCPAAATGGRIARSD